MKWLFGGQKDNKATDENKISVGAMLAAAYFVCMPFSVVPLPGGISLLKFISIIVGGFLIITLFVGTDNKLRFNLIHFFLGIYILYTVCSLFILRNDNAWISLRGMLETGTVLFLVTTRIYNKREKSLLVYSWIVVGIITVVAMLASNVQLGTSSRATMGIGGGNEDPNQLCGYFFLPILYCLEKMQEKSKLKFVYLALVFAMIYVAFLTGSRGGLIGIFFAIFAYVMLATKGIVKKLQILVVLIVLFSIFFAIVFPLLPTTLTERLSVKSVAEDKGSGRLDLWITLYNVIIQNDTGMIFGYGLGSTTEFLKDSATHSGVAHNHWIQIWCDQGLIGMLLFLLILIAGAARSFKHNKAIALSIVAMFVLSMSLTMYAYYKPFWNIIMMSALNFKGDD